MMTIVIYTCRINSAVADDDSAYFDIIQAMNPTYKMMIHK